MKKVLVMLILLIPFVASTIYTDSTLNSQYNLGDEIKLEGYLVENANSQGMLKLFVECGSDINQLSTKFIKIDSDGAGDFDYKFLANPQMHDSCFLRLRFEDTNSSNTDEIVTGSFLINKQLNSAFKIKENQYSNKFQLGDELYLLGAISNLNGININGIVTISIKKDEINYLVDSTQIKNGVFEYSTKLLQLPKGEYTIDFDVRDVNGNEQIYENSLNFILEDELVINAIPNKNSYLPGDIVSLNGQVQRKIGNYITGNKIEIDFDGIRYATDIIDGKFSFNIPSSKTIKSYEQKVNLFVTDEYENYGSQEIEIFIIPVPTAFNSQIDKTSYVPEDTIIITSNLYDQAGDNLSKKVDIKIKDVKGNILYEDSALVGDELKYQLPKFAVPGEWNLEAVSEGLKSNKIILVEKVKSFDINIVGEILTITNLGNEQFAEDVSIDANELTKTKSVKLQPNETIEIPLFKLFKGGTYTIYVLGKQFDDVTIIDKGILSKISNGIESVTAKAIGATSSRPNLSGILTLFLIVFGSIFLIYLVYKGGFKYYVNKKPDHLKRKYERIEGAKKARELRSTKKKYNFDFGKSDDKDLEDFRERMVESVKTQQAAEKQESSQPLFPRRNTFQRNNNPPRNNNSSGGAFSMFD